MLRSAFGSTSSVATLRQEVTENIESTTDPTLNERKTIVQESARAYGIRTCSCDGLATTSRARAYA